MPTFKGLSVHVVRKEPSNQQLPEWGVQRFHRMNTVSCYVQSESNMPFQIIIQPQLPFLAEDQTSELSQNGKRRRANSESHNVAMKDEESKDNTPTAHRIYNDGDGFTRGNSTSNPVPSSSHNGNSPFGYHLLASIYLDGRKKPERRAIVYIDRTHPEFNHPHGRVYLKARWVERRDGTLVEQGWYFKDVSLETLFDQIIISKAGHERSQASEDTDIGEEALIKAMNTSGIIPDSEADHNREQALGAGQIVVELKRVVLGKTWRELCYRPRHKEGEDHDVNVPGADKVSHTTGLRTGQEINPCMPVVTYTPYRDGEGLYAKFQFFYRSEEKLAEFLFENFRPKARLRARSNGQHLKFDPITSKFAFKALERCYDKKYFNHAGKTFEQVVKSGEQPERLPIVPNFGNEYRDQRKSHGHTDHLADSLNSPHWPPLVYVGSKSDGQLPGTAPEIVVKLPATSAYVRAVKLQPHKRTESSKDAFKENENTILNSSADERDPKSVKSIHGPYRQQPQESDADDERESDSDAKVAKCTHGLKQEFELYADDSEFGRDAEYGQLVNVKRCISSNGDDCGLRQKMECLGMSSLGKRSRTEESENGDMTKAVKRTAFDWNSSGKSHEA